MKNAELNGPESMVFGVRVCLRTFDAVFIISYDSSENKIHYQNTGCQQR